MSVLKRAPEFETNANQPFPGKARPALAAVASPGRRVPLAGDLVAAALARPARPEGSPGPVRLVPEVSHGALLATPPGVSPRAQAVLDGAGGREPGRLRHRDVEHHLSEITGSVKPGWRPIFGSVSGSENHFLGTFCVVRYRCLQSFPSHHAERFFRKVLVSSPPASGLLLQLATAQTGQGNSQNKT